MAGTAAQAEPRRAYRRFWFWCCCALAMVAVALPIALQITYAGARVSARRQVARAYSQMRAHGEPLLLSEAVPKVKPGEPNAADVYERAFQIAPTDKEGPDFVVRRTRLTSQQLAVARGFVDANARYLSLLDQSSRIQTAAFHTNWDAGADVKMPHLGKLRSGARGLALKAAVQASRGDPDGALASCAVIFRVGDHAVQTPVLVGYLVSVAIHGVGAAATEHVLSAGDPSEHAIRELSNQLARISPAESLVQDMKGERAWGLTVIDLASKDTGPSVPLRELTRGSRKRLAELMWNWQRLSYLGAMGDQIASLSRPYAEANEALEASEERTARLPEYRGLMARMIAPRGSRALWSAYRDIARLGAARVGLAVSAYHGGHGAYPASLTDLEKEGWKLPLDPFTQKPYQYRREVKGFTVWSVGPDLTDNHAAEYDSKVHKDLETPGYDVVFRCTR